MGKGHPERDELDELLEDLITQDKDMMEPAAFLFFRL